MNRLVIKRLPKISLVGSRTFSALPKSQTTTNIEVIRDYGHLKSSLDPLNMTGASGVDWNQFALPKSLLSLEQLENVYCKDIGYEFQHILVLLIILIVSLKKN